MSTKKTPLDELSEVATPVQFENLLKFNIKILQTHNFLCWYFFLITLRKVHVGGDISVHGYIIILK